LANLAGFFFQKSKKLDNNKDLIPLSWSVGLIGLSALFLLLFCLYAQMSFWVIIAFFLLFALLSIGFTRIRAESGILFHDLHFTGPDYILVKTLGSRQFTTSDLVLFSFFSFLIERILPIPCHIN